MPYGSLALSLNLRTTLLKCYVRARALKGADFRCEDLVLKCRRLQDGTHGYNFSEISGAQH